MYDGLGDFGEGMFSGAGAGAKVGSLGGPVGSAIGAGIGAIGGGFLSYFGGAQDRADRSRNNRNEFALQEFELGEAKRKRALELKAQKKKELFGQLLAQYFQRGAK